MNIKIVRDEEQPGWKLLSTDEGTAMNIIRTHVRAYDTDDDDLLVLYMNTALDYLQELTNRVLGTSVVTIKLNKKELRNPILVPKVQDVTHIHSLKYRTKDSDDKIPYAEEYSFYLDEVPENDIHDDMSVSGERAYTYNHSHHTENFTYTIQGQPSGFNATAYTTSLLKWDHDTSDFVVYVSVDTITGAYDGTRSIIDNAHLDEVGLYKVRDLLVNANAETHETNTYFVVTDGTDLFDCRVAYDRYPMYLKVDKILELPKDASEYEEDFVEIVLDAGTELSSLPYQYSQAALLLVGHYYNMREAENIGGITSEVKEGVHRLVQSVRQY